MKQEAWRRQPDAYPMRGELLPRHTDVDLWQHLNNSALIALHAEVCQRWLRAVLGDDVWRQTAPALAATDGATDFLAEAHYPQALDTGVRLLQAGPDGFTLGTALFQHGRCVGLHQSRYSHWADGLPVGLSADAAARVQAAWQAQPPVPGPEPAAAAEVPAGSRPVAAAEVPAGSRPGAAAGVSADPTPAVPPVLDQMPWRLALPSRFADVDAAWLASDAAMARCAEQSRVQLLTQLMGDQRQAATLGFMIGHVAVHWRRRRRPPATWQLGCRLSRVGERSVTMLTAVFDDQECQAECESVLVSIDRQARRSVAMPPALRERLAPFCG